MAYRSSLTAGVGASAANATFASAPAGSAVDDIAVVGIYKESTAAITAPSGWASKAALTTSATARGSLEVYWKRLVLADLSGSWVFSWTGAVWRGGLAGSWSGRITTGDPFDGTPGTAESVAGVTTLNVAATPATALGDAVGFWTNFNGGGAFTQPTNYLERQDISVITLDTRDAIAAGATGNVTATCTITDFMKAFLGVLAPAGAVTAKAPATISPYNSYH